MADDWVENARMIVESAGAIVPADGDLKRVRAQRFQSPGFSRAVFAEMARMGWLLLRLDEAQGGLALGMREYCELMRVLGRGLIPEPLVSSIFACRLAGDRLSDEVIAGDKIMVAAWQDAPNTLGWQGGGAGAGRLDGRKIHVAGATGADRFAVLTAAGVAIIERDAVGVAIEPAQMQDGSEFATLTFAGTAAEFQAGVEAALLLDEAILAQAAYLLGVSERAFELTLDYLRVRTQFGQPIGSFQALQHRATDIKIELELTRAAVLAAARRMDAGIEAPQRAASVSRAKARAAQLAMLVAREAIQMHGAIGFTDEADIGLFARKAMTEASHFGSARVHRTRFTEMLEGEAA